MDINEKSDVFFVFNPQIESPKSRKKDRSGSKTAIKDNPNRKDSIKPNSSPIMAKVTMA